MSEEATGSTGGNTSFGAHMTANGGGGVGAGPTAWEDDPEAMGPVDTRADGTRWQVRVCRDPDCPHRWGDGIHGHDVDL